MKKLFPLLLLALFASTALMSQSHNCGVIHSDDAIIKERLMRNRTEISSALSASRSTVYIPVTIHLIGSSSGSGLASVQKAMQMLCRLNTDFADQNVYFYLNGNIRFIYDDYMHSDSYDWGVMDEMGNNNVLNNLNIYVNANVSQPVAGYYSPSHDFVWMGNGYANGSSTTITHEVGHFFSLPHTFYGWEDTNPLTEFGLNPVPAIVNGHPVENVARNNCLTAGDGFCDTEADYISYRFGCPYLTSVQDPTGVEISPDATLYMSYAADECVTRFSQEQKDAMRADITGRGWLNLPAPQSTAGLSADNISPVTPALGSVVGGVSSIRFEWDTVGAATATGWYLLLERTLLGSTIGTVYTGVVNGQNFIDIPTSYLLSNKQYQWSVYPFSSGYACAAYSNKFNFNTGILSAVNQTEKQLLTGSVYPNPANTETVQLEIESDKNLNGNLRIFSADGRLSFEMPLEIAAGTQNFQLNTATLSSGLYILVLNTGSGVWTEKLIIAK